LFSQGKVFADWGSEILLCSNSNSITDSGLEAGKDRVKRVDSETKGRDQRANIHIGVGK
jgi:hypothetical protein